MQSLDNEYSEWRGDHYTKFSEEFDGWRKNRSRAGGASRSDFDSGKSSGNANQSNSSTGTSGQSGQKQK